MSCPKCKTSSCEAVELEQGLIAQQCCQCEGVVIPLLNYRYWSSASPQVTAVDELVETDDSHNAMLCPKCSRIMIKYRISLESDNRLDLCANCDDVWLDKGEWQLLKQQDLHLKLPSVLTDVWQRKLRNTHWANVQAERYTKTLGEEGFSRCKEFKTWMDSHEDKEQIKSYLLS